jgi:hypothetical protein
VIEQGGELQHFFWQRFPAANLSVQAQPAEVFGGRQPGAPRLVFDDLSFYRIAHHGQ